LKDKTGTVIASQIKIKLSLISKPGNNFETFMKSVDAGVSRLDGVTVTSAGISALGTALQLTKNIMDIISDVCHWYSFSIYCRSDLVVA
jgi:hypothetical protein